LNDKSQLDRIKLIKRKIKQIEQSDLCLPVANPRQEVLAVARDANAHKSRVVRASAGNLLGPKEKSAERRVSRSKECMILRQSKEKLMNSKLFERRQDEKGLGYLANVCHNQKPTQAQSKYSQIHYTRTPTKGTRKPLPQRTAEKSESKAKLQKKSAKPQKNCLKPCSPELRTHPQTIDTHCSQSSKKLQTLIILESSNKKLQQSITECQLSITNQDSANWQRLNYENGNIFFEGGVIDEVANGNGKLYYPNKVLEYEGGFYNNILHGVGTFYSENGSLLYRGGYDSGLRTGFGIEFYQTGAKLYEGEWKDDKWHGKGRWYNILGEVKSEGDFELGLPVDYKPKKTGKGAGKG
jgi:antitoxin component YwqK of YwqJK toxin-antitoxin module